ncbi:DNRLRE domain-containing protein [Streptomyces sp. SD15]
MSGKWAHRVGRRTTAAVVIGAVLAGGLAYTSLTGTQSERPPDAPRAQVGDTNRPIREADAMARATKTGKRVEITALRTAYSTTWATPEGTLRQRMHASPVRAKVEGRWRDIDTTLARVENGWAPRATNARMVFSAGSKGDDRDRASRSDFRRSFLTGPQVADAPGNPLVTLTTGGHDVVLTWPGEVPEPVVEGARALYSEIIPGVDLVLTADDLGFAQLLVVKNREAATDPRIASIAYGLTSPDLTFRLDPKSRLVSAEDAAGRVVSVSPTPLMWDSAGHSAKTDGTVGSDEAPPEPSDTASPAEEPAGEESSDAESPSEATTSTPPPASNDEPDPTPESRPPATDEAPESSLPTAPTGPSPSVPAEPTVAPSDSGTLALPGLDGPQPASHGSLVGASLDEGTWSLTPSQKLLTADDTVYPVFIDPSIKKHSDDWTTAYDNYPKANFYNGKGFNSGTHEARVGYESDTWGTSRSFFTIDWDPKLKGAKIYSATLYTLETYSWSCDGRTVDVYRTGAIDDDTTWANQPTWYERLDSKDVAHGYRSSRCPDEYVAFNVKEAAERAVDGGWGTLTLGLRARYENDQYAWKKFQADGQSGPYVELDYNRPPREPTNLDMDPELYCDTTADKDGKYVNVGKTAVAFWASATDPDGNLSKIHFDVWPTGDADNEVASVDISVGAEGGSKARVHTAEIPSSKFQTGKTYSWQARSIDKRGASSTNAPKGTTPCRFTFDGTPPSSPTVGSPDFPAADANRDGDTDDSGDNRWSEKRFGTQGTFTFKSSADAVHFDYGFNGSYDRSANRKSTDPLTVTVTDVKPPQAGPNVLYVRAVDSAGNPSQPSKYFFYVKPRDTADAAGDFTGDKLPDLFTVNGDNNLRLYPSEATTELTKGTGDLFASMPAAYRANPERDPADSDDPAYVSAPAGDWQDALITHLGDAYPGDGVEDLIARREGKLWLYPGDGYGGVNTDERQQIVLPSNAPDPATYTQIVAAGDVVGNDSKPDLFVLIGGEFWAFTGYNGASYQTANRLASSAWVDRDLVMVRDISGDGVTDLLYRTDASGRLLLRTGIKADAGGVDLGSIAAAADSANGVDDVYGTSGWNRSNIKLFAGGGDVNMDKIPDFWAFMADGGVRFYPGGRTTHAAPVTVIGTGNWANVKTIG